MITEALTSYAQATGSDPTALTTVEKRFLDAYGDPMLVVAVEGTNAPLLVADRTS